MSKAESIDALMESAIHCFSRYGYEGASLRDIAANAGVPLSTIHMYFGSKAELYWAIERKSWDEIDEERSALLTKVLERAGAAPPDVTDLILALALPVVRRALGDSVPGRECIIILRSGISGRTWGERSRYLDVADRSMVRWIDAMARACPTLSRQDIVWAFSFVVGAVYSWQLIDHRYDSLLGQDIDRTVDGIAGDIATFGAAGVRALMDKRLAESGIKAATPDRPLDACP